MICKTLAYLGILLLGGCAGQEISTEQPSFYASMASASAKLDAEGAASMISEYRRNNGLGSVTLDPELMRAAETQSQAMASRNKLDHDVAGRLVPLLEALAARFTHWLSNWCYAGGWCGNSHFPFLLH